MDTIYNRNIWKKRSLFGYSPEAVRLELYDIQENHSIEKEDLTKKLEVCQRKHKELNNQLDLLKKQFNEQVPVEEEITGSLFEKLIDTTIRVQQTKEDYQRELSYLETQLENKLLEREHLVEQLKETLQQLHTTFMNLGGMHHD